MTANKIWSASQGPTGEVFLPEVPLPPLKFGDILVADVAAAERIASRGHTVWMLRGPENHEFEGHVQAMLAEKDLCVAWARRLRFVDRMDQVFVPEPPRVAR